MTNYEIIQLLSQFRADSKITIYIKGHEEPFVIDGIEREVGTGDIKIEIVEK